jgi:hypothetical protein
MRSLKNYEDFLNEGFTDQYLDKVIDSFIKAVTSAQEAEESPRGSNKGKKVEAMQKKVGTEPGQPWCAAFLYDVANKVEIPTGMKSKIVKTAGVKVHWENSTQKKILAEDIRKNPTLLKPGMAFFYLVKSPNGSYPGPGHTGIILQVDPAKRTFTAIEGNTNPYDGSREGYGSFLVTRSVDDPSISKDQSTRPAKLLGAIDYFSGIRTPYFNQKIKEEVDKLIKTTLLPKTQKEIQFLKSNPQVLKDYDRNYKQRNKK